MDIGMFGIIVAALLAVSEALALIPSVNSNGIFQMLWNILKITAGRKEKEE